MVTAFELRNFYTYSLENVYIIYYKTLLKMMSGE